jgi:hypothetical protein
MATLTPEAKQILSRTIRELRELLLQGLRDSAEQRYRLSLLVARAKLPEELRKKRERLEAWLDERLRSADAKDRKAEEAVRSRFLDEALKESAATLVNRLVLLRHLEALGLSKPAVLTGGWTSKGYQELREFAPSLCGDETEGYATLLGWVFDELSVDLPGLFGDVGLTRLFPIPPALLREVVRRLDDPGLAPAWTDDTTLGWVYQYWNDPEREGLDAKLNDGGKIEPHEIASKTQMFTERYMVEWLLHNSLGLIWLCTCKKHGWTPDAEQVLPALDARRAEWRKKREAGEVPLDALMPIEGELEEHWKYFVPQPIPDDAVASAPDSIRTVKILDPACGSGHFLVIAFDLLAAMYREEARHLGQAISEREIAASILENNLHGIDIDPRAVQIAAAAVVLKAKRLARDARPRHVNLVAPVLRLGSLAEDDPALVRLRRELKAEAGIPEELTGKLVAALAGVDHLGSLLKVDAAIDDAIREQERAAGKPEATQGNLLSGRFPAQQAQIDWTVARASVLDRLESFLAHHAGEEDLGLRLDGEQLAGGVRFVRMTKEGTYHLVVGNPPYQGTNRMADAKYVGAKYPRAKADLYASFMERAMELVRSGGMSALLTMRGWMFLGQFEGTREYLLRAFDLRSLGDVDRGAFEDVPNEVLAAVMAVFRRSLPSECVSVAVQPTPLTDKSYDRERTKRKRAALLAQVGRFEFFASGFQKIQGWPLPYWWTSERVSRFGSALLGEEAPAMKGLCTGDNTRFNRFWHEVGLNRIFLSREPGEPESDYEWVPTIKGGEGREWFEPLVEVIRWRRSGLELRLFETVSKGVRFQNRGWYFKLGVAFTGIGSRFGARAHRYSSVFGDKGASLFPDDVPGATCLLNSSEAREILAALNPSVSFTPGDVDRLPVRRVSGASEIIRALEKAFSEHEARREGSVEFRAPGATSWRSAQELAQRSVDCPDGNASDRFDVREDRAQPLDFLSFAFGVCLGRFDANGAGIVGEPRKTALPAGILYVSAASNSDSLCNVHSASLNEVWTEHGKAVCEGGDLRTWLRTSFFKHHKTVYENRPIFLPLSSAKRSFVAWVSIHRWTSSTLTTLLADHLVPERRRLEGELDDLRKARAKPEKGVKAGAERRFAEVQKLLAELNEFIDHVTECAERGPPPTSPGEPKRERDAGYEMDLDDGVMVNSAALWPLLEPQWKDPKKWWKELAAAKGRKDYDWAHLAKRYFPSRVEEKCKEDPSLAVAHGCFWCLHPATAYAWELRLQDEIRPDFTIDEEGSDAARSAFLKDHAAEAEEIREKEQDRRERKARKAGDHDAKLKLALDEGEAEVEAEPEEVE